VWVDGWCWNDTVRQCVPELGCGNRKYSAADKSQSPSKRQTDKRTKKHARLSVVSVRGVQPMGKRSAMLHRNLRGGVIKIRDQHEIWSIDYHENPKNYCHQMSHFKAKLHRIRFYASVRLSVRWRLTHIWQSEMGKKTVGGSRSECAYTWLTHHGQCDDDNLKQHNYVRITIYQPDTKSNPNPNPNPNSPTKQHAITNVQLNMVTCLT